MERKRIGNDIKLRWALFNPDMTEVDLSGVLSMTVEVRTNRARRYPQEFVVNGNKVDFQFTAKEQVYPGVYDLYLQYTKEDETVEGGIATRTMDHCGAFELLQSSCGETDGDPITVEGVVTGLSYSSLTESEKEEITERLLDNPRLNTIKGDSAYRVAMDNGYAGTEQEWIASLKGDKGDEGEQGEKGEQGEQGERGETGDKGAPFLYSDFTPGQIEDIKRPALEAAGMATEAADEARELWQDTTDLSEIPGFDAAKRQILIHDSGVLKWEDHG